MTPVGWEHNILFNATTRYTVTRTGPVVDLPTLFDGGMMPYYTSTPISASNPVVILIEGLPEAHTQTGTWVGWTTRYWPANRFKIEGYDNGWVTVVDYSSTDYVGFNFSTQVPVPGTYRKLRFTFYNAENNGNLGLSELFFIHPEATHPYAGLLSYAATNWKDNGSNLIYNLGNVGIGVSSPQNKLDVNGTIHSKEVKVNMENWSDFVFKEEYKLPTIAEVERHIKEKGHLENIPSEEEVLKNGINLGEMNVKLLQKIEELTLYVIDLNKKVNDLEIKNDKLKEQNSFLSKEINNLRRR
ncbi:hypothetical protein SAMN02927916_3365 [Flavobacterium anhuiense]|uniref:Uncharacterized protein n=1 Tax=Flavobacterium anhuiense TaxID=459526 RepID=A0ABY0LY70_9FLAO|nr:hypothetical protein [Flavobacterium anhuiense]SCY78323.1 hypothetical protein SAMN02927916_3365 [Flavobacterium anhuiense]